jgi:hypothetical protein
VHHCPYGDVRSKEEIVARLRGLRIIVTEIAEDSGGEPADPDLAIAHGTSRESSSSQEPHVFRALLIVLAFVLAAAGVSYVAPVAHFTCERMSNDRVDCVVDESILGVYPLRTHKYAGVTSADIDSMREDVRDDLAEFVSRSADKSFSRWHWQQVPLVISGILLLLAALMLALTVLSTMCGPREWVRSRVAELERKRRK